MEKLTITGQITVSALEILGKHPEGLRWTDLLREIEVSNPDFHPKTVNGIVWQLPQKHPDTVYKPSKGIFRLIKYKNTGN